jgi:hypothetical protein
VAEAAAELERLIEPSGTGSAPEQLAASLGAYLSWIESNALTWRKLMESAASLPEAAEIVEGFRTRTLEIVLAGLIGRRKPRPALRTAIRGWLGYMDAAILDWTHARDLTRDQLRDLLMAAFGAAVLSAQHIDPKIRLRV